MVTLKYSSAGLFHKTNGVCYPDIDSMKTVASGCFEIRLKGSDGIYRAFYVLKTNYGILFFHRFKKKTEKTPKYEIETAKKETFGFYEGA